MPHELLLSFRVLAFAQAREVLGGDRSLQPPLLRQPALPLAVPLLIAAPIILLF
jgi:hypothetical protein